MKRLVLVSIVLFVSFFSVSAQDTIYYQEGNKIVKKIISFVNEIQIQEGIDVDFTPEEMNQLDKGKLVKKIKHKDAVPVMLLPVVKLESPIIISSFKKGEDDVVKKIKENIDYLYPEKTWGITIVWIFIPFIFVFVLAYLSTKNKDKGRKKLILFSFVTTLFLTITIFVTSIFGATIGELFGLWGGAIIGAITGLKIKSGIGLFFGLLAVGLAGVFVGFFTTQFTDPAILWQYVILYFGVCVLAFLFREVIAKRHKKLAS